MSNVTTGQSFKLPLKPWWKIPDFNKEIGDIKFIWELSRMEVLAFAQRARNGNDYALVKLNDWLTDWVETNPTYAGPNWKCGQEASIRVILPILCFYDFGPRA